MTAVIALTVVVVVESLVIVKMSGDLKSLTSSYYQIAIEEKNARDEDRAAMVAAALLVADEVDRLIQ